MGTSALTLPTMAMSKASISTPAMITIRIEFSIAFSAAVRAVLLGALLLIFQMVAEQPTETFGVCTEYGWGPGPEKAASRARDED
jgi:hypothetical protein